MAESGTVTGSRDDLVIDASRCLRMRYSESGCRHCIDICPHGAVTLDNGLFINPGQCRGCLLCTAACPVGALELNSDIDACLAQLSKVPETVLGCIRTREHANAALACLGGLSEEHLLALCHSLAGELTLNLSACVECPNSAMSPYLRLRLKTLSGAGLLDGGCCMRIADAAQDIHYRGESLDRRGFFNAFRTALLKSADIVLSSTNDRTERPIEYAVKRVPARRAVLNRTRSNLAQGLEVRLRKHFDSCVSIDETCSACQGCVAICPTGALQTMESDLLPTFDQGLCTGCGLCQEFCLDGAVRMRTSYGDPKPAEISTGSTSVK